MKHEMIFCVDGGGTRTRGRLFSPDGKELARAEGGPGNISTDPVIAAANTTAVWAECARQVGCDPSNPRNTILSVGAAGATVASSRSVYLDQCIAFERIILMTDGYAALVGAGHGRSCALVISGTGAVGHRLYEDGRSIRRDGWGWVAGDRGSGAWIGRKALRHAIEVYDGLVPLDKLSADVLERLEAEGGVQRGLTGIRPHQIAAFAPLVFAAAAEKEPVALAIIERAITHLSRLVELLDLTHDTPFYLAGGLGPLLRSGLSNRLQRDVLVPEADSVYGCYLVAAQKAPIENVALTAFKNGRC